MKPGNKLAIADCFNAKAPRGHAGLRKEGAHTLNDLFTHLHAECMGYLSPIRQAKKRDIFPNARQVV